MSLAAGQATMRTNQRGAAVVLAVIVLGAVSALGGALLWVASVDRRLAAVDQRRERVAAGAVVATEAAVAALAAEPDWTAVLSGLVRLPRGDPATVIDHAGVRLDLAELTRERQEAADRLARGQPDDPQWRVYGWGRLAALVAPAFADSDLLLLVWVADDGEDGDGEPWEDRNGRMQVRGEAFGPGRARAAWSAVVRREPHGVALLSARVPADWARDP
jgi:hypothetical protein